jgi:hypothetical protein
MAVRSAAAGQLEPLVPAMAALPERRARLAAGRSVVRPAEEARETAAGRRGDQRREQVAARAAVPQEVAVVPEALEAKEREVLWAPAGKVAAQERKVEASREPAA